MWGRSYASSTDFTAGVFVDVFWFDVGYSSLLWGFAKMCGLDFVLVSQVFCHGMLMKDV